MSGPRISRRGLLALAAGFACGACLPLVSCGRGGVGRGGPKQLNIMNWADYMHPATIPEFERRYGIEVVYDTFASNEQLLAKLQAGASNYDLVVPTGYTVQVLQKMGMLTALDHDRIANLDRLMPRFRRPGFDPGLRFSLPFTWGSTGIGYNTAAFGRRNLDRPSSWDVFWDERLARRMTLLDDARETIGMSLKRRGHSYNTVESEVVSAAVGDLKEQKPLTMAYTSDQVIIQLSSGDSLASLVYSGDAYQAARSNIQIRYVIPEEGASIWVDSWCIPKAAPHLDNAYLWLNYMMEPAVAAAIAEHTGYAVPNQDAVRLLPEETRNDPNRYPPDRVLERCDEIQDLGRHTFLFDRLWTELKCA